jgi:hypothetical protein
MINPGSANVSSMTVLDHMALEIFKSMLITDKFNYKPLSELRQIAIGQAQNLLNETIKENRIK